MIEQKYIKYPEWGGGGMGIILQWERKKNQLQNEETFSFAQIFTA